MLKNTYQTVEEAYNELVEPLTKYAERHIYAKDRALDAVQDAFVKAIEYQQKRPEAQINRYILYREVVRACRRINQVNREVSLTEEEMLSNEKRDVSKARGKVEPRLTEH